MSGQGIDTSAVGKRWPAATYEVGREKIREYSMVIGASSSFYFDREAARAAGFRDVVAPPMFAVVYSAPAMAPAVTDPEVGINFASMVHGGQEFEWGEPVCCGDTISTEVRLASIEEKAGNGFYVFESVSVNQQGEQVVRGIWTDIVRGAS